MLQYVALDPRRVADKRVIAGETNVGTMQDVAAFHNRISGTMKNHLHFELRVGPYPVYGDPKNDRKLNQNKSVDPMPFLRDFK